jgi:nicotinamidase-related amidase
MKQLAESILDDPRRPLGPHAAILAIHWQYDVVAPDGALSPTFAKSVGERGVIRKTALLLDFARSQRARVVHIIAQQEPAHSGHVANNALWNMVAKSDRFMKGTRGVEIVSELGPADTDVVLYHDRTSCFYGTGLLTYLVGNAVQDVYLSGVATNVAVDHTARDAVQYGFNTYLVEDCCASADMAFHEAALMTMRVLCTGIVVSDQILAAGGRAPKR